MDKKELQLYSLYLVKESNKSKQAKLQLLRFIENDASEHQLMVFILDDQIIKTDELSEQVIEARFKASNIVNEIKQQIKSKIKTVASIFGLLHGGILGAAIWAIYRKIKSRKDKCSKICGTFKINTTKRQYCILKCKIVYEKELLKLIAKIDPNKFGKPSKEIKRMKIEATYITKIKLKKYEAELKKYREVIIKKDLARM